MPPFKDEHILIIAPGSQVTLAQLGLPESFTPATTRLRTRMFPSGDGKTWEPYKVREVKKPPKNPDEDVEMGGTTDGEPKKDEEDDEPEYEEDLESEEGAVYPLTEGKITNMPAFLALLNHIHNILSPTLHTPILLIAQPAWTAQDHESLTQFFFEKFKTPAFCIMDSALAVSYAYGLGNATVVDVGYRKVDITAVADYSVQHVGRTIALPGAGGDAMTEHLLKLLSPKGWTWDMCEQLKKSAICEILPAGTPLPGTAEKEPEISNPAAAASTGATSSGPSVKITDGPRAPETEVADDDLENGETKVDDDGVLDVASIVASGKTQEFLAAQEKKKNAQALGRKAAKEAREAEAAAAAKPIRLPNSKREKVLFHYQERKAPEEVEEVLPNGTHSANEDSPELKKAEIVEPPASVPAPASTEPASTTNLSSTEPATTEPISATEQAPADQPPQDGTATTEDKPPATGEDATAGEAPAPVEEVPTAVPDNSIQVEDQSAKREQARAAKREEKRKARENQGNPGVVRREVEVGTERFLAADGGILDTIADAIHRTVLSVEEISKRAELWEAVIIVGNGSRVRGFKDALVNTLVTRYLISPSSATIFTSELPSNLSTPMGTGSQTPQREYPPGQQPLPTGSSVNPLLLAATTASNPALNQNISLSSSIAGGISHSHSSHSQSPTSIKTAKIPEYFPEFKNDGFEEAVFLGAQVAAKVIFVQDQGVSAGFMSRVQYNETGPSGIHEVGLAF